MTGRRQSKSRGSSRGILTLLLILLIAAVLAAGIYYYLSRGEDGGGSSGDVAPATPSGESLRVHFLDIGQADCILIESAAGTVMIDAGDNGDEKEICEYLESLNINSIDLLIGTHAHADHIGGMDGVISSLDAVGQTILPTKPSDTKTYRDVTDAIASRGFPSRTASEGEVFSAAGGTLTVIDDGSDNENDFNNNSYILKFTYGETDFLFTGDAETKYEREVLEKGKNIDVEVIKAGHHGSDTSSCEAFLKAASPQYAAVCVGTGNKYGHPSQETLDRFKRLGIEYLRTDLDGDIVFSTDGSTLSVLKPAA